MRNHAGAKIALRNTDILSLAAIVTAIQIGIAKHSASFFGHDATFGPIIFFIAVLTCAGQIVITEITAAAGDRERHNHAVAYFYISDLSSDFLYDAHEFVAHDHGSGLRYAAGIHVKVASADGGRGDFQDNVGGCFKFGIVYSVAGNLTRTVKKLLLSYLYF